MMWAKVKFEFEGVHRYPGAKGREEFLKHPHRHLFKCTAWVEQFHSERDVEYIKLKRALETRFKSKNGVFSCEMVAFQIAKWLKIYAPGRRVKVEVTEDGENGALYEEEAPCCNSHKK